MVIPDAYVCGNCPGASDSNPGTQQRPVATIARGIQNAIAGNRPIVFIASNYAGSAHIYSEDVTLVQGRSLQGRWTVLNSGGTLVWARTGPTPRTTLQNTAASGLKSPAGITNATFVEGMIIHQASFVGSRLVGIQVSSSSPTLREITVQGPILSGPVPNESVGIEVLGGGVGSANPILGTGPTMTRNTISPMGASVTSSGLVVTNARIQVQLTDFSGGPASSSSRGAYLSDSPQSSFLDTTFAGGLAPSCFGFFSQGVATTTLLERVTAIGCPRTTSGGGLVPRLGYGVAFDACGPPTGMGSALVRNSSVQGGVVGGMGSAAVGASATDGCDVRFESTGMSTSTYLGASGTPTGSPLTPETAIGLICSFRGLRTANGFDSRCIVNSTSIFGGSVGSARSYGLACEGSCANQNSSCQGSCFEVTNNTITAQTGNPMSHVVVTNSSPQLRQNRIGFGGNGTYCNPGTLVRGVEMSGAGGALINNLILGGPCTTAIGVEQVLARRPDNSVPSTTFHSNTIGGSPPFGSAISSTQVSVGVSLSGGSGSPLSLQGGVWRNNILFAGPVVASIGSRQAAFEERAVVADPSAAQNNLFWVFGSAPPLPFYVNEASVVLSTATGINTLMDMFSQNNVAADPLFVNPGLGNYSLGPASPASRAGTTAGAPVIDLTGVTARPSPTGTNPDIGCLEATF